ncbi:hypothetical protein GALMADRAFT_77237, partial [Galerina marginata CBS 339.88]
MIELSSFEIPIGASYSTITLPRWNEYQPTAPRRSRLGDALAHMAEHALQSYQPYPGDSS